MQTIEGIQKRIREAHEEGTRIERMQAEDRQTFQECRVALARLRKSAELFAPNKSGLLL